MGKPPYDDPDTLDLMRSDAASALGSVTPDGPEVPTAEQGLSGFPPASGVDVPTAEQGLTGFPPASGVDVPTAEQGLSGFPPTEGFEVPSDVVALGELHFHLD